MQILGDLGGDVFQVKLIRSQFDILIKPIKPHRVKVREGLSYLEAWDVRAHLIRVFGFGGWSADVTDMQLLYEVETTTKQGKDGLVHRVLPGNFIGQNDGKIVGITGTRISVIEIVPDGLGGYIERPAALALTE